MSDEEFENEEGMEEPTEEKDFLEDKVLKLEVSIKKMEERFNVVQKVVENHNNLLKTLNDNFAELVKG